MTQYQKPQTTFIQKCHCVEHIQTPKTTPPAELTRPLARHLKTQPKDKNNTTRGDTNEAALASTFKHGHPMCKRQRSRDHAQQNAINIRESYKQNYTTNGQVGKC
jgi:hypothetical protein